MSFVISRSIQCPVRPSPGRSWTVRGQSWFKQKTLFISGSPFRACAVILTGFPQAIEAVYPNAEIQQCIIHQIRNSTKYVSYKDLKKLMADLKTFYSAPDEQTAVSNLEEFGKKWDSKYPQIHKSWSERWPTLATYFKYPEAVRRLIYTTNTIEGFNRQLRKVTKSKTVFPSDDSLLKMLYLAMMDITKNGPGTGRTGDRSTLNWRSSLKNVLQGTDIKISCLGTAVFWLAQNRKCRRGSGGAQPPNRSPY